MITAESRKFPVTKEKGFEMGIRGYSQLYGLGTGMGSAEASSRRAPWCVNILKGLDQTAGLALTLGSSKGCIICSLGLCCLLPRRLQPDQTADCARDTDDAVIEFDQT